MKRSVAICAVLLAVCALFTGVRAGDKEVILATTTSTQDTGLLDVLVPLFREKTGYFLKVIAVGSGQAMALGERGEADVLVVHSPEEEKRFIKGANGVNRRLLMHNDFVIVGPGNDPAKIKGLRSSAGALGKIAASGSLFMSRGDSSGTHVKELKLWGEAKVDLKKARWYQQTGLGMGQTLNVASEKSAYTLCDRATYLALRKNLSLVILVEGDPGLRNVYHIIEVNAVRWPRVNARGARAFSDFMVSAEVQGIIGRFGVDRYGSPLFFPDAGKPEGE
jgi:tungstate transport system substrate-binding protein